MRRPPASATSGSRSGDLTGVQRELSALRAALDAALVGQDSAKTGLLLALVGRQHAYLEGPPGCGKSLLAETLAARSGARVAAVRFHRDIRSSDLLGDTVLRREGTRLGERVTREIDPGPLLRAELALLDDVSRAPGEALGPLLRVLSERRALGRELPLECAVATAPPPELELYSDPLEPTQLDRFAVQVRMQGLLVGRRWDEARRVIAGAASGPSEPETGESAAVLGREERWRLQRAARELPIGQTTRRGLLRLIEVLRAAAAGDGPALLTDRAFGVAAPALMRAHALLRGGERVEPEDLRAVRFMLGRRAPPSVLAGFEALLSEVIAETSRPTLAGQVHSGAAGRAGEAGQERAARAEVVGATSQLAAPRERPAAAADAEPLLRALAGRMERGRAERDEDPAGQPRSYGPLRRLDEVFDADELDAQLWVEGRLPGSPRVFRRKRRNAGGALAVLRDVSASMEGPLASWAGQVIAGLVRRASRGRMRIGYIEFNHSAEPYRAGGAFFHRSYQRLLGYAARARAEGRTNYEAPLESALTEFRGSAGRSRHIVLLTDGVPVLGDPEVRRERALARRLGVKVHTVFLGAGLCPRVLDLLSLETGGLRFAGRRDADGRVSVVPREGAP